MEKVKLNELADIYLGVTHTPEYVFEGVPFLSVKDISGGKVCFNDCKYISKEEYDSLSEGAKPKVGDMLFCRVGTLGKPIIIPEGTPLFGSFVSLGYLRNRNSDRCDLNYLRYWMYSNSFWKQVNANVKGASQVNLNTGWLSKFDIDLPGIAEQKYRISVLDKCKSVIEKREAELAALDDLIKVRFVEMFGDPLDKLRANDYFMECVEFNPTKLEVKDLMDETVSFVPMECIGVDGSFAIKEDGLVKDYYKGYTYFKDGDVLLAKITPCFENGKVAIAENCTNGIGFGTTEFHVLRPIVGVSNSYWIKYMLKNDNVHGLATINMTGSAGQKRIQTPFFENLKIYLPSIELQNQFADFVCQVDKSKVAVQKALDETQLLFDSLMQEYFG